MPAVDAGLAHDRALIEQTVRTAGGIARGFFGGDYKKWDKGKGQPVTDADLAVDAYLRETLTGARPDYGWLSEETKDTPDRKTREFVFVADPIDGTIAFMKGRPHFTVCVALVRGHRPIIGAVYNPMLEEFYSAAEGVGATLNGKPIHVSQRDALEGCRMLGDRTMFVHPAWNKAPSAAWPPMEIESRNSVAYRMVLVASGAFDATVALSAKRDWDIAAADLIVREAGGIVTTHDGHIPRYNGDQAIQPSIVCAGPALHRQILARVNHLQLSR